MPGLTDQTDRRWLLPIPILLLVAQVVYVVRPSSPLLTGASFGLVLAGGWSLLGHQ